MNHLNVILTAYPLSAHFERLVANLMVGKVRSCTIAQLRTEGLIGLVVKLWSIRVDQLFIPIEEVNSSALLPVLKLLAAFTRAKSICIVHPDLSQELVKRSQIVIDVMHFIKASASCVFAALRAQNELRGLAKKERLAVSVSGANERILYLKTNLWFGIKAGGSVGHISGVVNALQRLCHKVTFAAAEPPVMIDTEVDFFPVQPPVAFGIPYELNNYRFQNDFFSALKDSNILSTTEVIYQRLSAANYLGVTLSRRQKIPLVVEYNGSEVWVAKHWGRGMRFHELALMAEDVMLRHAHLVVTVSEVLRDELIERGVEPERIVCYPNCIDPLIFDPDRFTLENRLSLRARYGIVSDAVVITFVGTFGQWHGTEMLANAIVKLFNEQYDWLVRNKVHFMLVGDGLRMPAVRSILEESGAIKICTLTGLVRQEEAALYLASADILVSPHVPNADGTRFFGSPTKLFEYMAMAKGIIASDLNQIGDVMRPALNVTMLTAEKPSLESSEVGILYEPGNLMQLLAAIKFLVEDEAWRNNLGKNARAKVLAEYTWSRHVSLIINRLTRPLCN